MREPGSGAQRVFEQALQDWGVAINQLDIVLNLSSSEMVKSVVESGYGAASLPELMVQKELQLGTLHAIRVMDDRTDAQNFLEIVQPVFKLKHRQRFQTQMALAFEQLLRQSSKYSSSNEIIKNLRKTPI